MKKGTVLLWLSVFGLIAALGIFFAMTATQPVTQAFKGQQQLQMLSTYQEAEEILFYIDQAASYALPAAVDKLGKAGGFVEPGCGTYLEYNIWNTDCFPDYKSNLNKYIDTELNPYLESAPQPTQRIPLNNYDYVITENTIAGIAKEPLAFFTPVPGRIEYYVKPSFRVDFNHNIERYDTLIGQSIQLLSQCKDTEDLEECIKLRQPEEWIPVCNTDTEEPLNPKMHRFCLLMDAREYRIALEFE